MMASECIQCGSYETELWEGDDGHFRKECNSCDHVGGPYVSKQNRDVSINDDSGGDEESEVSTLDEWLS